MLGPWDMLNNFWFHVYDQKALFIGENRNDFLTTSSTPAPVTFDLIKLVPSKKCLKVRQALGTS